MAVNQSHTENRRGAIIPFGERCLKGSRGTGRGAVRGGRKPAGGAGGLKTLSQWGPFPPFPGTTGGAPPPPFERARRRLGA